MNQEEKFLIKDKYDAVVLTASSLKKCLEFVCKSEYGMWLYIFEENSKAPIVCLKRYADGLIMQSSRDHANEVDNLIKEVHNEEKNS